jgi:fatty-acyl-CoA synthase/O-succinylbenzoic acid--CoA ligase
LAFEKKYSVPILHNYGQTEFAGAIAFERPDDIAAGIRPQNTVGRVAPGVEVAILGADGNRRRAGEVGEIVARAVSAMSGYLDPDGTPADPGGWLHTGDLGILDDQGFLFVVGRVRDMVVSGGFNVYPAQVEAALNDLPPVADSAVTGVPDERLGEVPVAAVVLHTGVSASVDEIRNGLRARLAAYELPRKIAVVDEIPRLETGKVDRASVAKLFKGALA